MQAGAVHSGAVVSEGRTLSLDARPSLAWDAPRCEGAHRRGAWLGSPPRTPTSSGSEGAFAFLATSPRANPTGPSSLSGSRYRAGSSWVTLSLRRMVTLTAGSGSV